MDKRNKRIAKNTIMLYGRTFILLLLSLYSTRVVLEALGVEDYGVYSAVAGIVTMMAALKNTLSTVTCRYLSFALGKNDMVYLKKVFVASINLQYIIIGIVFLLGEFVGVWFLNTQMQIPENKMFAANIVLQNTLLSLVFTLISVPYNAAIIAHEKMNAFAYISVLEGVLRLIVALSLFLFLKNRLIIYSVFLTLIWIVIRMIYVIYCKHHFEECNYKFSLEKDCVKDMASFVSWNFVSSTISVFNRHGLGLLMNTFFGVVVNAAQGVVARVTGFISQFVTNFSTAIRPQTIQAYAAGDINRFYSLIIRGSKYSIFLLFMPILPFLIETDFLLGLWLKNVPEHTADFVRLALINEVVYYASSMLITGVFAVGKPKSYFVTCSILNSLVLPCIYLVFRMGASVEFSYVFFIFTSAILLLIRLFYLKKQAKVEAMPFVWQVVVRTIFVAVLSIILPLIIYRNWCGNELVRVILVLVSCEVSLFVVIAAVGLKKEERAQWLSMIRKKLHL